MNKEIEVEVPYDVWLRLNQAFERYRLIAESVLAEKHLEPKKGTPILFVTTRKIH